MIIAKMKCDRLINIKLDAQTYLLKLHVRIVQIDGPKTKQKKLNKNEWRK